MQNIHAVIRNIKSKNLLSENMNSYTEIYKTTAGSFAGVSLAFQSLSLLEAVQTDYLGKIRDEECDPDMKEALSLCVSEMVSMSSKKAMNCENLKKARELNKTGMERLSDAADVFSLCEYVLNRQEHRFLGESEVPAEYSDEDTCTDIMAFLASLKGEEQNLAIVQIMEQLPIRITKNRFYETLVNRLSVYLESDEKSFRSIVDMVKSAGGIHQEFPKAAIYQPLVECREICMADMADVTKEQFEDLSAVMAMTGKALNKAMDLGSILQAVINELLVISLSEQIENVMENESIAMMTTGIAGELEQILKGSSELPDVDYYSYCGNLEVALENTQIDYQEAESFRGDVESRAEEMNDEALMDDFSVLREISTLLSNSAFASTEDDGSDELLSEMVFQKETTALVAAFSGLFANVKKHYQRAVMAHISGVLPHHFSSQEELETMIFESLRGCTNAAEKLGCLDVIEQIMKE